MSVAIEGTRQRGYLKKPWWDCVQEAMKSLACPMSMSMVRIKVMIGH